MAAHLIVVKPPSREAAGMGSPGTGHIWDSAFGAAAVGWYRTSIYFEARSGLVAVRPAAHLIPGDRRRIACFLMRMAREGEAEVERRRHGNKEESTESTDTMVVLLLDRSCDSYVSVLRCVCVFKGISRHLGVSQDGTEFRRLVGALSAPIGFSIAALGRFAELLWLADDGTWDDIAGLRQPDNSDGVRPFASSSPTRQPPASLGAADSRRQTRRRHRQTGGLQETRTEARSLRTGV
ncbi:hypothetical protein CMUS01_11348 [Colletotrichum musicola]|uniref:Uncharacterized protein n=1 Tax=Colletotrichum musicola TaxID=2175873 RepID=A0A8H6JYF7_9PEZI|nr:hypothetical protein CMUS01_11348 [Colletotrichum musicola]